MEEDEQGFWESFGYHNHGDPGKSRDMTAIEPRAGAVPRFKWRRAKVRQVIVETSRVKSLLPQVNGWQGHLPGQHVDIRLSAEDGYQAQRSYSIASPPEDEFVTLTVDASGERRSFSISR
jgi:hypothetical protein